MDQFEPLHVMIMENSLPAVENTEMHYVFDMKGSSINREVLKGTSNSSLKNGEPTGSKVLKDLDYVRLNEIKSFFNMDNIDCTRQLAAIEKDVKFLMQQRFMDYSLLMAIKKVGTDDDSVVNKHMDFEENDQKEEGIEIENFAVH